MVTYVINRTSNSNPSIKVDEKDVNKDLAITLFGRARLEYGEEMNENILHLLENFACPQDPYSATVKPWISDDPDVGALDYTLENAIDGQLWYNSTDEMLYILKEGSWVPLSLFGEVASNYGTIAHGSQLPLPVSSTGETFTYEECSWMVSPLTYDEEIEYMACTTDTDDSTVFMQYKPIGSPTLINGSVNYMIIGIRGNVNRGTNVVQPPSVSPTATPAATVTPTPTFGVTVTVTPTNSVPPTPSPTESPPPASVTPTPSFIPPPIGGTTRLYVYPSPGYSSDISSGITYHANSCGDLVWPDQDPSTVAAFRHLYFSYALERNMIIRLNSITGGVPPYTVDFSNCASTGSDITDTYMLWAGDPNPYQLPVTDPASLPRRIAGYFGGDRKSSSEPWVRINVDEGESCYVRFETYVGNTSGWPDLDQASYIGWHMEVYGSVRVTDSVGQSKTWWVTADAEQAGGSNQTSNPGSVYKASQSWNHYYSCSGCSGCLDQLRILGYP